MLTHVCCCVKEIAIHKEYARALGRVADIRDYALVIPYLPNPFVGFFIRKCAMMAMVVVTIFLLHVGLRTQHVRFPGTPQASYSAEPM